MRSAIIFRYRVITGLTVLMAMFLFADVGLATHGSFNVSTGIYRVPYADVLSVTASNDHHNHPNAPDRVDMAAGAGTQIVAAASGIIRAVVDFNGDDFGRGDGLGSDGITPQVDSLENNCSGDGNSGLVVGGCGGYNNYVWIEHPNGEWTKYTHFQTGTVSIDNSWSVGDTILVGQPLGLEGNVGAASGSHLHHEVAIFTDPNDLTPFTTLGGFLQGGVNVVATVCFLDGDDNGDNLYTDNESYTAGPCVNTAPTADAGGPYEVDEGSSIMLDGTASSDPHNAVLNFSWSPATNLMNPNTAVPLYNGLDDTVDNLTLTVNDEGGDVTPALALEDDDTATVTVLNVPPTVNAIGDTINEGGAATVSATFTDPGTLDTHTATIDWDDGSPLQVVDVLVLAAGVDHIYPDNGVFGVVVTVTDDDGGAGDDTATVTVGNLDPALTLDTGAAITFPGGDYLVVEAGGELPLSADGIDPGSDDLTFDWNVGAVNIHFNNGIGPDPVPSPFGTFPFNATDAMGVVYAVPGFEAVVVTLTDDDGGSDLPAEANVVVTGNADDTQDSGWWKHQYSDQGSKHIDNATAEAYLDIVNAVSSVFSESTAAATTEDVHEILTRPDGDTRAWAVAELMEAWLQFASGAVGYASTVPQGGGATIAFLDLMFDAEATILDGSATDSELLAVALALQKVRHAF